MGDTVRTWSVITCCECPHTETIDPTKTYHVLMEPRWQLNAAYSKVRLIHVPVYICDPCWEALPE